MICETAFTMDASGIKFGPGATRELGYDMQQLGVKRAMLATDPNLAPPPDYSRPQQVVLLSLAAGHQGLAKFGSTDLIKRRNRFDGASPLNTSVIHSLKK